MSKKLTLISLLEIVTAGVTGSNETDRLSNLPVCVELPDGFVFDLYQEVEIKEDELVLLAGHHSAFSEDK